MYYKPMTIINDDSRVVNKLETSLNNDTRVIIYDRHMFIVHATAKNIDGIINLILSYYLVDEYIDK